MSVISIPNWRRFQHYGKEKPPWIKLYRDTLADFEVMHRLEPAERWVVVGLWILAAETGNAIPRDVAYLQHRLIAPVTDELLRKLQILGIIEVGAESRASLDEVYAKTETETETETETTAPAVPEENVENSTVEQPTYTKGELLEAANDTLGLGLLDHRDQLANARLLNGWLYRSNPRSSDEVWAAIHGLALMRDADRVGWDSVKPGKPVGLRALEGTHTLFDQGDGKTQRPMWDVAVEAYRTDESHGARTSGLRAVKVMI